MKNIILINGSARKNGNTAQMLEKVKNGANSVGASVEIINLFDLDYKGCSACYACKIKLPPKDNLFLNNSKWILLVTIC